MSQEKSMGAASRLSGGLLKLVERTPREQGAAVLLSEQEAISPSLEQYAASADYSNLESFDPLFRQQVAKSPQAIAVVEGEQRLTYRELDERVERLARHLQKAGAGPEQLVAVVAERGWKLLTTLLAIFRAGGIYVPLDPQEPVARLRRLLEHSGSKILLTPTRAGVALIQQAFAQYSGELPTVLCIEELLAKEIAEGSEGEIINHLGARQAAYVLYTSEAKGEPKGIVVEQRGLVHWCYALLGELQLTESDSVAQVAPISSDLSIWQMLAPLLAGARVEIFADAVAQNPLSLIQQVGEKQVSILQMVPTTLRTLLEKLERIEAFLPELFDLRWLLLTGEVLTSDLCLRWFKLYPRIPLFNLYGPAEASGDATVEKIMMPSPATIALGRPLPHAQVYILNELCKRASPGETGEIYLGGTGIVRGYLAEAAETAAVFVPDPFGQVQGARLYKTGDWGRWREDGTLEYLGRLDRQVKIQGYRVELTEVETRLKEHPAVSQCAVLLKEDTVGKKQLLAYVVPQEGQEATPAEGQLQEFLQQLLPAYMLPAAYNFLEQLPLLPDGSLDQRALLAVTPQPVVIQAAGDKPGTPLEEVLAMVWSEVLGSEPPGVDADFFENGGHSLLALEFMARASDLFDLALPLPWLFENPTIAGLARVMLEDESQRSHINTIARSLIEVVNMSDDQVDLLLQDLN